MFYNKRDSGYVLIFILWALSLLSMFALQVGLNTRQKLTLLSRLEKRSQLFYAADAGVKKAIALLKSSVEKGSEKSLSRVNVLRHNNPGQFSDIAIGENSSEVSYSAYDQASGERVTRYGVADEQSKLNLNTASFSELTRLLQYGLNFDPQRADDLASAIIDWRERLKESQSGGFYSDDYYDNLEYPYRPKRSPFEVLDELLLIRGVHPRIYAELLNYVTIYGDGKVNINTASRPVLLAMGLEAELVEKILSFRRGFDGIEGTGDEYVFESVDRVANILNQVIALSAAEIQQVFNLTVQSKLTGVSDYFSIQSIAKTANSQETKIITCVYNLPDNKIDYWHEF
ncbi:MAG: hypothetical protein WC552_04910 [Candidatus Omnitrophota bacterium]